MCICFKNSNFTPHSKIDMSYNKLFIVFIISIFSLSVSAQKSKVKNDPTHDLKAMHFGFSLGTNFQDYNITPSQLARDTNIYVGLKAVSPGLDIHAIANFRLAKYLDFRMLPGISFGQRLVYFENQAGETIYEENSNVKLEASYIEMPMLFKYKAKRMNNASAFIVGGGNVKYDLTAKQRYDEDQKLIVSPFDVYAEIGGGFDFYLEFFKFSVEMKYGIGVNNILRTTDNAGKSNENYPAYTDLIESIRSQVVVLSFHFE